MSFLENNSRVRNNHKNINSERSVFRCMFKHTIVSSKSLERWLNKSARGVWGHFPSTRRVNFIISVTSLKASVFTCWPSSQSPGFDLVRVFSPCQQALTAGVAVPTVFIWSISWALNSTKNPVTRATVTDAVFSVGSQRIFFLLPSTHKTSNLSGITLIFPVRNLETWVSTAGGPPSVECGRAGAPGPSGVSVLAWNLLFLWWGPAWFLESYSPD